ncbi:MAG: RagB/SusD family nutrient uptake outer membrane protein [Gemmatimonadota bacterium]
MRSTMREMGRRILAAGMLSGLAAGLVGCGELLDQQAPSRLLESTLQGADAAKGLVDGARAAFGCAFQAYIMGYGLITDELEDTQLAAAAWDWDRRSWLPIGGNYATSACDGGQQFGIYVPMQTARYTADQAAVNLAKFTDAEVPNRGTLLATASAYSGYAHLLLGEGFCTMAIDGGPELQPAAVFALAEGKFTDAITSATAANNTQLLNLARIGRARTRLDLAKLPGQAINNAKLTDARADAAAVPAGFLYNIPYNSASTFSRNNIFERNRGAFGLLYGVAPTDRGLTFGGVADPRVKTTQGGRGADAVSFTWTIDKYASNAAPIPLARYAEAQLIIAEADYTLVNPDAAVPVINALHTAAGLPSFASTDPAEILNQLIQERAREFFLESQHGYDMNRFNTPQVPAPGTAFQAPGNNKGGQYGSIRCLPLPDVERNNNPNVSVAR